MIPTAVVTDFTMIFFYKKQEQYVQFNIDSDKNFTDKMCIFLLFYSTIKMKWLPQLINISHKM